MKASKKIVFPIATGVAVLVLSVVIVFRVAAENGHQFAGSPITPIKASSSMATKELSFSGFDAVTAGGAWTVSVQRGPYSVKVHANENLLPHLGFRVQGKRLVISMQSGIRITGNGVFNVTVTTPSLIRITARGASQFSVSGFDEDRIDIDASDASAVALSQGAFSALSVRASGAARVDCSAVPSTSAMVDSSGSALVALKMDGGDLSGSASGASRITYVGSLNHERVSISGAGSISPHR